MLNWDDLRHLLWVSRTGSMAAAARALNSDQSTVSRRLKRLSETMGHPVLVKTGPVWRIAPEIEPILNHLEDLDHLIATWMNDLGHTATGAKAKVTLRAPVYVLNYLINRFALTPALFDTLLVNFVRGDSAEGLGTADIVISTTRPSIGRIKLSRVGTTEFGFYKRAGPSDAAASEERWISLSESGLHEDFDETGEQVFGAPPALRFDDFDQVQRAILQTGLPGPLPYHRAERIDGLERIGGEELVIAVDYWVFFHESRQNDPAIRSLVDFARTEFDRVGQ